MSDTKEINILVLNSVILALREDIGKGDITTNSVITADAKTSAKIIVKENGIICGMPIARLVFQSVDKNLKFSEKVKDGNFVKKGTIAAIVSGPARGILTAERTALNFLQRLSGISTLTNKFVKAAGKRVKILDTRKTSPGLRVLEKYAVKMGGGCNHRIGLFDAVLIKDNHIAVAGGLKQAVRAAKKKLNTIEVETSTLGEVKDAIGSGVSRIMLDNMSIAGIKKAVQLIRSSKSKIEIEVSGGITLKNIRKIAGTGIDYISIGALTHSAPALDISLKVYSS
jgi:nicotinate-nucleotide pyrophosphorylase (carboxylating)